MFVFITMAVLSASSASAQVTPAAGFTPPDDTPVIRIGTTIFGNFTYQTDPKITDVDGNSVKKSSFDIARAYLNITGNVSHIVAFRVTPDVNSTRLSLSGNNLDGSLVFRLKYAYAQFNLDDWMSRGSYAKFGIQQTPYIDFIEGIYRYRFQGTVFVERLGYVPSSDAGAGFRYNLPSNYGDLFIGLYSGEGYNKAEVNDQKSTQMRASIRPFARAMPVLRGVRGTVAYNADSPVKDGARSRLFASVTFEHPHVNAAFEYVNATDQTSGKPGSTKVEGSGYSMWVIPKQAANSTGWEGLIRYDHLTPNTATTFAPASTAGNTTTRLDSQEQNRLIVGIAYWFPHTGGATTALMLDYDGQIFKNLTAAPTKNIAVHLLVNF